jgi:hypothetical protein
MEEVLLTRRPSEVSSEATKAQLRRAEANARTILGRGECVWTSAFSLAALHLPGGL